MFMQKLRSGALGYGLTLEEVESLDEENQGVCRHCGNTQDAEPDAVQYQCDACGDLAVYGAAEYALRGWVR